LWAMGRDRFPLDERDARGRDVVAVALAGGGVRDEGGRPVGVWRGARVGCALPAVSMPARGGAQVVWGAGVWRGEVVFGGCVGAQLARLGGIGADDDTLGADPSWLSSWTALVFGCGFSVSTV
jgi:hypothetical protein